MARKGSLFRLDSEGPILEYMEIPSYDEKSLQRWADFCSLCFKEKADLGGKYFLDNLHNDPNPDFSKIFVAVERKSNVLGAAVRIVRRKLLLGSTYADVVGLADVCTDKRCRREGVGTRLISFVLKNCRDAGEMTFILHCDEKYHSFYARVGFHMLRSQWSLISTHMRETDVEDFCKEYRSKIALVDVTRDQIISSASKFAAMSGNACIELGLQGTMEKNPQYFKDWVAKSHFFDSTTGGIFRCICDKRFVNGGDIIDTEEYLRTCMAYVCLMPSSKHRGQFKICDIGVLVSHGHNFADYLMYLAVDLESQASSDGFRNIKLEVPSAAGIFLSSSGLFSSHLFETDNGWMISTGDIEIRDTYDCEFSCWPIDLF